MDQTDFPIVGIGASAGGLEAITEFFSKIPIHTNLTYVIIQHLSPDHESKMPELLARHTALPISVIQDEETVVPGHIYLIPPKYRVEIRVRKLHLIRIESARNQFHFPIDLFFRTLGKDLQANAASIVLSGTGSDGSRGIKTIKEQGGLVLAQDPQQAKFDGMPRNAIDTNLVDFVASPEELAVYLINYFQNRFQIQKKAPDLSIYEQILGLIYEVTQNDFRLYKSGTIERRIEKRMGILGLNHIEDYLEVLKDSPEECQLLHQEFLIRVTSFLRDPEVFETLNQSVIPLLYQQEDQTRKLRVWVVGCATGEEAYSLAMLLEEYRQINQSPIDYKIFASDIDRDALRKAGRGVFGARIIDELPADFLFKYFKEIKGGYQVKPFLRNKIVFAEHNIISNPPYSNQDLILCRNLLIYFRPELQKEVFQRFAYAIQPKGFLLLGGSEGIHTDQKDFEAFHEKAKIFRSRKDISNTAKTYAFYAGEQLPNIRIPETAIPEPETDLPAESPPPPTTRADAWKQKDIYAHLLVDEYAPDCLVINDAGDLLYLGGNAQRFLSFPRRKMSLNVEEMTSPRFRFVVQDAITKLRQQGHPTIFYRDVLMQENRPQELVNLFIKLLSDYPDSSERLYLIEIRQEETEPEEVLVVDKVGSDEVLQLRIQQLEQELSKTRHQLLEATEELRTKQEEFQATNEELYSANEELQSLNEELQSVNEELYSVNSELQATNIQAIETKEYLDNILLSAEIATVYVDESLCIRKYTNYLQELLEIPADLLVEGQKIDTLLQYLGQTDLLATIQKIKQRRQNKEEEILYRDRHLLLSMRPFRTVQNRYEGMVINFTDITELKKTQISAEYNEKVFNQYMNLSPIKAWIKDEDLNFIYANPGIEKVFKVPAKEMVGKDDFDFLPEELAQQVQENDRQVLRELITISPEESVPDQNGEMRDYQVYKFPVQVQDKVFVGGMAIDITERKRELREARQRQKEAQSQTRYWRQILEAGFDMVVVLDQQYQVQYINRTLPPYTVEGVLHTSVMEYMDADTQKITSSKLREAALKKAPVRYESLNRLREERPRYLNNLIVPILKAGKLDTFAIISQDITEAKEETEKNRALREELAEKNQNLSQLNRRLESNLKSLEQAHQVARQAQLRWKAITESSSDYIAFLDSSGHILYVNRPYPSMAAIRFGEKEIYLQDYLLDKHRKPISELLKRVAKDKVSQSYISNAVNPEGKDTWLLHSFHPVLREEGELEKILLISRDITESQLKENYLREFNAQMEEMNQELEQNIEQMQRLNHQLELFIQHVPSAVAMFDTDMCYLVASRSWMRDYRLESVEVIGRSHYEIFPEIPQAWKEIHQRCLQGEILRQEEDSFVRQDGRTEYLRWEIHPWYSPKGEIGGIIMFTEVITQQKEAEAALKESEEKYRLLAENSQDMICLHEPDGRYVYVSPSCRTLLGYTPESLIGNDPYDYFHPHDIEYIRNKAHQSALKGKLEKVDYRFLHKRGEYLWVQTITKAIFDKKGEVTYLQTTTREIGEQKEYEFKLAELNNELNTSNEELVVSNEQLSQLNEEIQSAYEQIKKSEQDLIQQKNLLNLIISSAGEGINVADQDGKFFISNEMSDRLLGFNLDEMKSKPEEWPQIAGVYDPKTKAAYPYDKLPMHLALKGKATKGVELYIQNDRVPEGYYINATGNPLKNEAGEVIGGIVIFRDITEQKQREKEIQKLNNHLEKEVKRRTRELEETNRELETFNYSISHDLRAPLRAIMGNLFLYQEINKDRLGHEETKLIESARKGAERMGDLVDDLLAFSRVGRSSIKRGEVNMYTLAEEVFDEQIALFGNPTVAFTLERIPGTTGDKSMLRLVLTNLLSNAIKYSSRRKESKVQVGYFENNQENTYFVKDNGVGFDQAYADKIFEVFQRAHLRKEFDGNGVGLAIVKRIIEKHGGQIWAESQPEQGATFYFTL